MRLTATAVAAPRLLHHLSDLRDPRVIAYASHPRAPVVICVGALLLWVAALGSVQIRAVNDLGLVAVLPTGAFVALGLLVLSYALALRQQPLRTDVLLLHVGTLIFMLYGATTVIGEAPRFTIAWRHVGVAEYIARTGTVSPLIDAYHNWPGFFALIAFVSDVAGFDSAIHLAPWAPVVFNLLYLGPLIVILRTAAVDERTVWIGIWFFCLTNWIGQDYLAPQALGFFLYLVVLAVILVWFRTTARAVRGKQTVALMGIVLLLLVAIVSSHQLTPFFLLASLAGLVVVRRIDGQGLPVLLAVMIGAWAGFPALGFFSGHLGMLLGDAQAVSSSVQANVADRLGGSPEHLVVAQARVALTALVLMLAALGALRRLRAGHRDVAFWVLAVAPFPFVILQPYGGEMLLRVYLFALPPVVFFLAALVAPVEAARLPWRSAVAVIAMSGVLLVGFLLARYGNERMDYMTVQDVEAVRYLYELAESDLAGGAPTAVGGSERPLLLAASYNLPWRYRDYERYDYEIFDASLVASVREDPARAAEEVAELLVSRSAGAYLILTRSQGAELELMRGEPPGILTRLREALTQSEQFVRVFANDDAAIFRLAVQAA